jgi:hypothetical protein
METTSILVVSGFSENWSLTTQFSPPSSVRKIVLETVYLAGPVAAGVLESEQPERSNEGEIRKGRMIIFLSLVDILFLIIFRRCFKTPSKSWRVLPVFLFPPLYRRTVKFQNGEKFGMQPHTTKKASRASIVISCQL